jgi:hypothetical protein
MEINDRPLGCSGRAADQNACKTDGSETRELHGPLLRQVELRGPRKRSGVDEQAAGERPTSTRCRFCGFEEGPSDARAVREKPHLQVVVACGSCGHPFAVLSRN